MAGRTPRRKPSGGGSPDIARRIYSWIVQPLLWALFFAAGAIFTNLDRIPELPGKLREFRISLPFRTTATRKPAPPPRTAEPGGAKSVVGQIVKVYDGDTATLDTADGVRYKVRFFGIDAPEAKQEYGVESGSLLRQLIDGREVRLEIIDTDRYGRSVAKVYCDGVYINLRMVEEGGAWYYAAYAKNEHDLERAMNEAQRSRKGLWRHTSPQPPWEYRKTLRSQ